MRTTITWLDNMHCRMELRNLKSPTVSQNLNFVLNTGSQRGPLLLYPLHSHSWTDSKIRWETAKDWSLAKATIYGIIGCPLGFRLFLRRETDVFFIGDPMSNFHNVRTKLVLPMPGPPRKVTPTDCHAFWSLSRCPELSILFIVASWPIVLVSKSMGDTSSSSCSSISSSGKCSSCSLSSFSCAIWCNSLTTISVTRFLLRLAL